MVYKAQVWILNRKPGINNIQVEDFHLHEDVLHDLKDGEIICMAEYISADLEFEGCETRNYTYHADMQVARVIESKNPKYPVGSHIYGNFGWRTHTLVSFFDSVHTCPDIGSISKSFMFSSCGEPGVAAYLGLKEVLQITEGKTIAISGAGSITGLIAAQICKNEGLIVIGLTSKGEERCRWLRTELGVDETINYETKTNIQEELKQKAPNGIDYYFDNVGGRISFHVINHMNNYGRIAVCDSIYLNHPTPPEVPQITNFHRKFLRMEGFQAERWRETKWNEGVSQMRKWIEGGQIRTPETVISGFQNLPRAVIQGIPNSNIGKTIVKI